jgi:hypothetical protein
MSLFPFFHFPRAPLLCHTCWHGKQRQRQERSQEGAEAQTQTRARPQARRVHSRSTQVSAATAGVLTRFASHEDAKKALLSAEGFFVCACFPPPKERRANRLRAISVFFEASASPVMNPFKQEVEPCRCIVPFFPFLSAYPEALRLHSCPRRLRLRFLLLCRPTVLQSALRWKAVALWVWRTWA